jgi:hypothetical protein
MSVSLDGFVETRDGKIDLPLRASGGQVVAETFSHGGVGRRPLASFSWGFAKAVRAIRVVNIS